MAEEVKTMVTTSTTGTSGLSDSITINYPKTDSKPDEPKEPKTPTIEELTLQLAQANAEKARFKNSIDKLTHENSELNKWKKERMTAQEQQDEADLEAKARQEAYVKELEQYKAINEASQRYIAMGMPLDLAKATATAEVSGDMDTVLKNVNQNKIDAITQAKAEWLKSRPEMHDGSGQSAVSVEQFRNMSLIARTKLRREDPDTYARLLAEE